MIKRSLIMLVLLVSLTGCFSSQTSGFSVETVALDDGQVIQSYPKNPNRIVVFTFGVGQTIDNLGIEIVGIPFENLPNNLTHLSQSAHNVGTLKEPDFEAVASLKPDLIIIETRQLTMRSEFEKIAPTIYMGTEADDYLGSFTRNMENLEKLFDKEIIELNLKVIFETISKIKELNESAIEKTMMLMVNGDELATFGEVSRFGLLYQSLGFESVDSSILDSTHGQKISYEYIVEMNPDRIYVIDRSAVIEGQNVANQLLDNELIRNLKAYDNNQIYFLDSSVWYTQAGGIESTQSMLDEILNTLNK